MRREPSAFASNSGDCSAHGVALPVESILVFQTLRVGVPFASTPPRTTMPSDTGTALEPALGWGRARVSTVCHGPTVPSLPTVRL